MWAHKAMSKIGMITPWPDPRTGILYFRKRIPTRFMPVAKTTSGIIKISLGTADRKAIAKPWAEAQAKYAALEADWLRRLDTVSLTPVEIAARWSAWIASGAKLERGGEDASVFDLSEMTDDGRTPWNLAAMVERLTFHAREALRLVGLETTMDRLQAVTIAIHDPVRAAYVEADLKGLGADINRDLAILRALRTVLPVQDETAAPTPPVGVKVPLLTLFDGWKTGTVVKPRTVADTRYILDGLIKHLGRDDAGVITRADLAGWRDKLKAAGLTNNTWNNRLSLVRQVFEYGHREGLLVTNVADAKLRLSKSKTATRLPYSDADTVRILHAARLEARPSVRWAPWIMAFTGMRVGEVLQLSVRDIGQDGGIWFIAVHEDDDDKSVKTGQRRNVPIHPALLREGLVAYAQALPDQTGPLFPDKGIDVHGRRGSRAWQVTGRWVRETVGIDDERKAPNHAFRHRFEDELRAAEVPEDARDAIVGHARKTTGRQYGVRGESLRRLAREIEKVGVPEELFSCEFGPRLTQS